VIGQFTYCLRFIAYVFSVAIIQAAERWDKMNRYLVFSLF